MRTKIVAFSFVLMAGFLNLGLIPSVQAQYICDCCFDMQRDEGTCILKLGVYDIGGGHLLVSGSLICSGEGVQYPVHGNVEGLNGTLRGTLVGSSITNEGRESLVIDFDLDPATLNGGFRTIETEAICSPGSGGCQFEQLGSEGTLTFRSCP